MSTQKPSKEPFKYVKYLWQDDVANQLSGVDRLVYRSNKLGEDLTLTNTGGGNTSSKLMEKDPLTGDDVEVLWLKGSGGDLRTAKRDGFASLYLEKVRAMKSLYLSSPERGPKTAIEDAMYPMYSHCVFNLNPRACSIDTPLHTLVPYQTRRPPAPECGYRHRCLGQPGAALQRDLRRRGDLRPVAAAGLRHRPDHRGPHQGEPAGQGRSARSSRNEFLEQRRQDLLRDGAGDHRSRRAYIEERDRGEQTFGGQKYTLGWKRLKEGASLSEIIPFLRGQVSVYKRFVGTVQDDEKMLRFVNSKDATRLAALGTSCPDHFLRTKIKPLFVNWDPATGDIETLKESILEGMVEYRKDYAAYYNSCKRPDSPAMRDPNPTVVLIPGLGMIAWGKNKSESRVTAEFYNCAIEVMRGAEAIDQYEAMDQQEAFDIEYWSLEEAKLQRMPPEKELDRRIVVIIGAGAGIGKSTAHRVVKEGAHVVCVDLDEATAQETAQEIIDKYGEGIGVAGTGLSNCGPAIGLGCDITNRESVARMFNDVMLAYGGIDVVIVTAGIFVPPDKSGRIDDTLWARTFSINVTGAYIVADEAYKIFKKQGLPGNIVLTTSANAVVAKKGSLAYDTSKAAANHLVRELAIEMSPLVRVNAVAPATVVKGSTMFPRDRVIASLAKYDIPFDESEETEDLARQAGAVLRQTLAHADPDRAGRSG